MKLGMITDSLPDLSFADLLETSARLGLSHLEFGTGNWSSAPHLDRAALLDSPSARRNFMSALADHGLSLSALNCSGNPLHPGTAGKIQHQVTLETIRLAGLLGVDRVVLMSGLPGGPGDANPNWIVADWPPECRTILAYQWEECLIPYWRDLVDFAADCGIRKLCLELHPGQCVFNVHTLLRLRDAVGEAVGCNYDPSHPLWMGADPLQQIRALGPAIFHVHAKDTRIEPLSAGRDGTLETRPSEAIGERAWNYVTMGYGQSETWWRHFIMALIQSGYDDVLSIEHEDQAMSPLEGVEKSVALLKSIATNLPGRAT